LKLLCALRLLKHVILPIHTQKTHVQAHNLQAHMPKQVGIPKISQYLYLRLLKHEPLPTHIFKALTCASTQFVSAHAHAIMDTLPSQLLHMHPLKQIPTCSKALTSTQFTDAHTHANAKLAADFFEPLMDSTVHRCKHESFPHACMSVQPKTIRHNTHSHPHPQLVSFAHQSTTVRSRTSAEQMQQNTCTTSPQTMETYPLTPIALCRRAWTNTQTTLSSHTHMLQSATGPLLENSIHHQLQPHAVCVNR